MKKNLSFILILILTLLTACSSDKVNREVKVEKDDMAKEEVANGASIDDDSAVDKEVEVIYEVNERTWSVEPIDPAQTNPKVVLLTIDDAPDKHALEMAQTLKALNAPAIFFVNGHFLETPEKKKMLKEIHALGFAIGNHTYSHPYLPKLSAEAQTNEIIQVSDQVEAIIGERPIYFRAPNGANTDVTREVVRNEQMTLMNWTYGYDWEKAYMSKEAITNIMVDSELLTDGANLLMHDRDWTAAGLADIVTGLRNKGYEFVDPSQIKRTE